MAVTTFFESPVFGGSSVSCNAMGVNDDGTFVGPSLCIYTLTPDDTPTTIRAALVAAYDPPDGNPVGTVLWINDGG